MPPDGCLWHAFGMAHQPPAPLVLPDGRPLHVAAEDFRDGEGLALPPVFSFAAVIGGASKTYYHDRFDEAMRHSRENALAMRRDAFLMSLLQERKMAVSSLPWYLETPDPKDKLQAKVRGVLTQCLRGTRGLRRMILSWLEAIWYGRYGNQFSWRWQEVEGRRTLSVDRWAPLNGDKIGYHWDGTPYVLVNAARAANLPGAVLANTTRARALSLLGGWRDRFIIHQHEIDDADYFEAEAGDGRHGVGVRSRVYWLDFLKREYLDWVVTYLERVGLGTTLWKYDASSPEQKAKAEEAARDNSRRVNITVPVWPDRAGGYSGGVERIEAPMGGVEALRTMIEAMDQYIERFIIGQAGSSQSQSSGLGNEAASEFMSSTKDAIRDHDAHLLAETITGSDQDPGLLSLMQRYSFPETTPDRPNGFPVLFKFGLEKSLNNQRVQSISSIVQMGLPVRKDDIYNAAGLSRPEPHDDVLEPQQPGGPGGAGGNPLAAMLGGGGPPGGDVPPDGGGGEDAPASEEDVDSFLSELFGDDAEGGGEPEEDRASEEDVDGFLGELFGEGEEDEQPQQMARQGRGVEQHHSRINPVLPPPRRPLRYGWEMTRELGDGRKRWKGTEEDKGKYRTQRIKPGTRVKSSGDNRRSIGEHIDTLLNSPESFTPEHKDDLRSKLLTLTRDQFAALRSQFGIRKQGRRKEDEVNTLLEGVEERKGPDPRAGRNREGLGQVPPPGKKVPGVEYVRAKPGGETSPVDGRFYKGGQLMPVHGLYSGTEKVKGGGKQVGTPVQADPNAKGKDRTPAQPMSPEMIEERRREAEHRKQWQEIKQSPLGRMKFLGESPSHKVVTDGRTDLKGWMEFSEELGPARLESLTSALEAAIPEKDREYIKDDARHQAGYDAQSTPSARKHEREAPGSLYARQLLGSMMSEGKSLESMYKAAQILSASAGQPEAGPQEGDTNAEGLVFHDGHWRREEDPRPQRNREGLGGAKVPEKRQSAFATVPTEPELYDLVKEAYQRLHAKTKAIGGTVKLPELVDELKKVYPALTTEQANQMLHSMSRKDLFGIGKTNDPRLEPRSDEGIKTERGIRYYVNFADEDLRKKHPDANKANDRQPQEGDTNAEGLVFRDGHWRREEDPRPQRNRQGLGQVQPPEKRKVSLTPQPGNSPAGGQREKPSEQVARAVVASADDYRERLGLPPTKHALKFVPLSKIHPSQFGEDYDNESSRELARKTKDGGISDRAADHYPVILDEEGNILDGNHRHAAASMNGEEGLWAVAPEA